MRLTIPQREKLEEIERYPQLYENRDVLPLSTALIIHALKRKGAVEIKPGWEETRTIRLTDAGRDAITNRNPGQPKKHTDNAARQRAYRERKAASEG